MTTLTVQLGARSYPIVVGAGVLSCAADHVLRAVSPSSVAVVTHPKLAPLYAAPLAEGLRAAGVPTQVIEIAAGERSKNLRTVGRLYDRLVDAGLDRKSALVAVGGGVLGDIVGFAAATYLRGVDFVQVPTTLLAQVDASVGGKTGVDLPAGKNLVGAFHQPKAVLVDTDTLATLPQRELRSGLAEVVKYGIISDNSFYVWLGSNALAVRRLDAAALAHAIHRSCEIKAQVVSADETEQGLRAILNFGHTVGHALEVVTGYRRFKHGEAVAIGMVSACLIGEEAGVTDHKVTNRVIAGLLLAGLPYLFPKDLSLDDVIAATRRDKKSVAGQVSFVLVRDIGDVVITRDVPARAVSAALERHQAMDR